MALLAPQLQERPIYSERSDPTALDGGVTRSPHYARNAASAPVSRPEGAAWWPSRSNRAAKEC